MRILFEIHGPANGRAQGKRCQSSAGAVAAAAKTAPKAVDITLISIRRFCRTISFGRSAKRV